MSEAIEFLDDFYELLDLENFITDDSGTCINCEAVLAEALIKNSSSPQLHN